VESVKKPLAATDYRVWQYSGVANDDTQQIKKTGLCQVLSPCQDEVGLAVNTKTVETIQLMHSAA